MLVPFVLIAPSPVIATTPRRVLLVGDGVMYDAVPAIEAALGGAAGMTVTAAPVLGFGLTRPEWEDWRRSWPAFVGRVRPDVVVLLVGPWDIRTLTIGGRRLRPGTDEWAQRYGAIARRVVSVLTRGGAQVVWLGMPWVGTPGSRPRVAALNAVVREIAERDRRVRFVDTAAALAGPSGRYQAVQWERGRRVRVMKPDGVHLCPDGAARVATAVATALRVRVDGAWRAGTWREDERYHWAPGGGCPPV